MPLTTPLEVESSDAVVRLDVSDASWMPAGAAAWAIGCGIWIPIGVVEMVTCCGPPIPIGIEDTAGVGLGDWMHNPGHLLTQ